MRSRKVSLGQGTNGTNRNAPPVAGRSPLASPTASNNVHGSPMGNSRYDNNNGHQKKRTLASKVAGGPNARLLVSNDRDLEVHGDQKLINDRSQNVVENIINIS